MNHASTSASSSSRSFVRQGGEGLSTSAGSSGHQDFNSSVGSTSFGGGYDSDAGDATTALLRAQEPDYGSDMDDGHGGRSCYNGNGSVQIRNFRSRSRKNASPSLESSGPSSKKEGKSISRTGARSIKIKGHHRSISVNGFGSTFSDASTLDHSTRSKSHGRRSPLHHKPSNLKHSRTRTRTEETGLLSAHSGGEMGMDLVFEGNDDLELNTAEACAYEGEVSSDAEEEDDEEDDFHEAMLNGSDFFSQQSRAAEKTHLMSRNGFGQVKGSDSTHDGERAFLFGASASGSTTDIDAEDTPATTPRSPVSVGGELDININYSDHSASNNASQSTSSIQQPLTASSNSNPGQKISPSKSRLKVEVAKPTPPTTRTRSSLNSSTSSTVNKVSNSVKSKIDGDATGKTSTSSSPDGSTTPKRKREAVFAHALPSPPKPRADAGKLFLSLPYGESEEEHEEGRGGRRGKTSENGDLKRGGDGKGSKVDGKEGTQAQEDGTGKLSVKTKDLPSRRGASQRSTLTATKCNPSTNLSQSTNTPSRRDHKQTPSTSRLSDQSSSQAGERLGMTSTSPLMSPSDSVRALHLHLNLGKLSSGFSGITSPTLLTPGLHRSGSGMGVDEESGLSPSALGGGEGLKEPAPLQLPESVTSTQRRSQPLEEDDLNRIERKEQVEEDEVGRMLTSPSKNKQKTRNSFGKQVRQLSPFSTFSNQAPPQSTRDGLEDEEDSVSSLSAGSDWLANARSVSADLSPTTEERAEDLDMLHDLGRPEDMPLSELDLAWGLESGEMEGVGKENGVQDRASSPPAGPGNKNSRKAPASLVPQKRLSSGVADGGEEEQEGVQVAKKRGRPARRPKA